MPAMAQKMPKTVEQAICWHCEVQHLSHFNHTGKI